MSKKNGQPDTTISERKAQAAAELGIDPKNVHTSKLEINRLREKGILIRMHVTGSSLFTMRALYCEYGVGDGANGKKNGKTSKRKEVLDPGAKNLIPRSYINSRQSRETRVRTLPNKFGYEDLFSADVKGVWWIPFTSWQDFLVALQELVEEDEVWKAEIKSSREALLAWCRETFAESANEAWDSLVTKKRMPAPLKVEDHEFISRAAFVEWVVNDAVDHFPTDQEIEACQISYSVSLLSTSADLEVEKARLAQAEAEIAAAQAETVIKRTEADEKIQASKIKLAAMQKAQHEAAVKQLEAAQPMAEFIARLRGKTLEYLAKVKETLTATGNLPPKTADLGRRLPEIYQMLSAGVKDEQAEKLLADLKTAIGHDTKHRDLAAVAKAVEELEAELSQSVEEIKKRRPSGFQFLELDD